MSEEFLKNLGLKPGHYATYETKPDDAIASDTNAGSKAGSNGLVFNEDYIGSTGLFFPGQVTYYKDYER